MSRRTGIAVALLAMTALVAGTVEAGTWKGQETTVDGKLVVKNPTAPMDAPITVELEELWRLGGDTDNEDEFFGVISQILADPSGNVYLLDSQLSEVKVFSADGEFLRTLGREGEGPGEFRRPSDMCFLPGGLLGVVQLAPGRLVQLKTDGTPAGEHPIPQVGDAGSVFLMNARSANDGSNLVMSLMINKFDSGRLDQARILARVSPEGKELNRLHEENRVWEFANAIIAEKVWDTYDRRWTVANDGRVMAVTTHPDYRIHVWKKDGTLDRIIEREYTHLARTAEEMEWVKGIYEAFTRQAPNSTIEIENNWKDVQNIYPREDGSLWVMSSNGLKKRPDGSVGVFDVFDKKGRLVTQVTLKGEGDPMNDGYFFVQDRLYVVTDFLQAAMAAQGGGTDTEELDEEPEPMQVICYQLNVPAFAGAGEE